MDIQKSIKTAKKSLEEIKQYLLEEDERRSKDEAVLDESVDAYFADIERREQNVIDQVTELRRGIKEIDDELAKYAEAVAAGDADAAGKMERQTSELEAKRAALRSRIAMFAKTPIRGSDRLFASAKAKNDALEKEYEVLKSTKFEIMDLAKDQLYYWQNLENKLKAPIYAGAGLRRFAPGFDRMAEHHKRGGDIPARVQEILAECNQ